MKRYIAIKIGSFIGVYNDSDELGGLIDHNVDFEVLGTVCDKQEFGDNCSAVCYAYRHGVCRADVVTDSNGYKWHVLKNL